MLVARSSGSLPRPRDVGLEAHIYLIVYFYLLFVHVHLPVHVSVHVHVVVPVHVPVHYCTSLLFCHSMKSIKHEYAFLRLQ